MSEPRPERPWEEDHGKDEAYLYAHGFHRVRGLPGMWQRGRAGNPIGEAEIYTMQEAYEQIAHERRGDES